MSPSPALQLPRTFNRLAWSNLAAQSAEQIALAAAPIVAVLLLGVGEGQTGALQTALTLPFVLAAIPAGLLADRVSRRLLMAGAEALLAAALAAILLLIWLGALKLPLLALSASRGLRHCGHSIAAPAWCPSLVTAHCRPPMADRTRPHRRICGNPRRRACRMDGLTRLWLCRDAVGDTVAALSNIREPRTAAPRHPLTEIGEGVDRDAARAAAPVFITQFIFNTASSCC